MSANIWQQLPRPFLALAPMDDVSDSAFRRLLNKYGPPDLFFSEFTAAKSVIANDRFARLKLAHQSSERPLIAQIWGREPEQFYQAAQILASQGFSGIDINMGCPKRQLTSKGCCAALIHEPGLSQELIDACRQGAGGLPISVKTRIGWRETDLNWLGHLLSTGIAALSVHYRPARHARDSLNHPDYPLWQTLKATIPKALADGPADFSSAQQLRSLRDQYAPQTLLLANGGLFNPALLPLLPVHDGWLIARAAIENPLFFANCRRQSQPFPQLPYRQRVILALDHLAFHQQFYLPLVGEMRFPLMKRFISNYFRGERLVVQLLRCDNYQQAENLLKGQI